MDKIEHFFVLKPDGKIYWVEKMPDEPLRTNMGGNDYRDRAFNGAHEDAYKIELQSAIDNAVEVSNQEEVIHEWRKQEKSCDRYYHLEPGKVYSLQCSVEKIDNVYGIKIDNPVALVTFSSSSGVEDTQEETFTRIEVMKMMESYADHVYKGYYVHKHDVEDILETLSPSKIIDEFKTRKTP